MSHPPTQCVSRTGNLLDSDLEHWREWPKICWSINKSPSDEYFGVPRGRVLYDTGEGRGVIYHGSATSPVRLNDVAEAFQLNAWVAATDLHYEMGDIVDEMFDDDD
ncbi:hypothetical protein [Lacipirellula parvula]|uniref:hypothetical protein n=1 Tax=Lacipirellula parvula TaxID=2650471 RepID=UPI0012611CE1|nr:hypothetical protein [Lacipirellula parvula]